MTLGVAFLGSGLATELHTRTLRAIAPDVARWYASRDEGRAARLARRHRGAGSFGSYEAALASPDVDIALVALPPAAHLEWTLRALAAGKHVIVEKPPFLQSADFDRVEAAARQAQRQVLVAENYFYKPLARLLRDVIARGDIGDVRLIQLNALKRQPTGDWRDDPALAGGGALFEGGIHWVSLLANIGLTPRRVRAAFSGGRSPERTAVVTVEYDEGAVATLAYSWDLPGLINGVRWSRMYGTAGSVLFETNGIIACVTGRRPRVSVRGLGDLAGYRGMMSDFLASIRGNRPPAYDLALARRDLRLIEEAYATAH
jgi:predicted dehydrogenase